MCNVAFVDVLCNFYYRVERCISSEFDCCFEARKRYTHCWPDGDAVSSWCLSRCDTRVIRIFHLPGTCSIIDMRADIMLPYVQSKVKTKESVDGTCVEIVDSDDEDRSDVKRRKHA